MRKYYFIMFMVILAGFFPFADNGVASFSGQNGETRMKNDWIYRKQLLLEYGALATTKNEVPLRDFQSGTDEASRAIGHAKTVLVFHLLRRMAGEEAYSRLSGTNTVEDPVRSWDEIKERFEKELGQDLGWFFKQWVDRKGLPDLRVEQCLGPAEWQPVQDQL